MLNPLTPNRMDKAMPTLNDPKLLRGQAFIDGVWTDAADGATFAPVNPATGSAGIKQEV